MQYQSLAIPPPARHSASSNTSDSGASRKSPELRNENPRRHVGAHSSEVSSLSQDGSLAQLYSRPESGDSYLHDRVMDHLSNDTSNGQLATQTTPSERSPRWSRDPEKGMSSESPRQPHHTSPSTEQLGMADDEDNGNIEEKVETDRHPVWVLVSVYSCFLPTLFPTETCSNLCSQPSSTSPVFRRFSPLAYLYIPSWGLSPSSLPRPSTSAPLDIVSANTSATCIHPLYAASYASYTPPYQTRLLGIPPCSSWSILPALCMQAQSHCALGWRRCSGFTRTYSGTRPMAANRVIGRTMGKRPWQGWRVGGRGG